MKRLYKAIALVHAQIPDFFYWLCP